MPLLLQQSAWETQPKRDSVSKTNPPPFTGTPCPLALVHTGQGIPRSLGLSPGTISYPPQPCLKPSRSALRVPSALLSSWKLGSASKQLLEEIVVVSPTFPMSWGEAGVLLRPCYGFQKISLPFRAPGSLKRTTTG